MSLSQNIKAKMLRLCVHNFCAQYQSALHPTLNRLVTQKLKCVGFTRPSILRHFSSEIHEENKLEQVYYGPLTPQIRAVKVFSLSSSIAGLIAQPIILKEATTIGSTSLLIAICSVVGFFTFVTPILLHLVTKKYVTEIYYDPDKSMYRANTINFFLRIKEVEFTSEDVEVPDIPGMFTTLNAKGKPLFIEARFFTEPTHYAKIMGYDKPMDFKLGSLDESSDDKVDKK